MTLPVFFAVATNIIAFLPLLFVPGQNGRFFQVLPAVVIAVFVVSLAECLLILPAHLATVVVGAYVASGRIPFTFRPTTETDFIQAEIELPSGTPVDRTREVVFQIEETAKRAIAATGEENIVVGISMAVADNASNKEEVSVTLVSQSQRTITGKEFAALWCRELPPFQTSNRSSSTTSTAPAGRPRSTSS